MSYQYYPLTPNQARTFVPYTPQNPGPIVLGRIRDAKASIYDSLKDLENLNDASRSYLWELNFRRVGGTVEWKHGQTTDAAWWESNAKAIRQALENFQRVEKEAKKFKKEERKRKEAEKKGKEKEKKKDDKDKKKKKEKKEEKSPQQQRLLTYPGQPSQAAGNQVATYQGYYNQGQSSGYAGNQAPGYQGSYGQGQPSGYTGNQASGYQGYYNQGRPSGYTGNQTSTFRSYYDPRSSDSGQR